ncbi:MAG TPA: phenylalanine--tRNA ligase subunit beta [Thermodesulfobacteriota bacterium]|nr:phenylalanine--tRNA ligase subunit beta [Thermodesulfobacteriota bacterium]
MIITVNWLREYVDFGITPEELADRLTMAGLEVEGVEHRGKGLENIVVAEILGMRPHPDATKLSLCDVSDGERSYAIVCGASNMKSGDKVALAKIGTNLPPGPKFPEGMTIKKAKIRGETSEGMLCAENEIGLGEESDGIMVLPPSSKIGARLIDELGLSDVVFEINVTPNRPDCLSVVGIAREVAALLGIKLNYPPTIVIESDEDIRQLAEVELLDREKCPRYSCRVIKNVNIGPSPMWLKSRLEASGVRSINNVVDVTNYVLLELGQPLHAFDYDLIEGRKIIVRAAGEGEVITTLDSVERKLSPEDLLICDGKRPVALAGVMGGANTEVSDGTKNILLESAYFDPSAIRKTSRKTGLKSESSYRFERGVDPNGITKALDRAADLIRELSGGQVAKGSIDEYPATIEPSLVRLSLNRVNSILGTAIDALEITRISEGLGFVNAASSNGEITFRIPTWRVDVTREIDLIEEIARLYGYGRIPSTLPTVTMKTERTDPAKIVVKRFKEIFVSEGFSEAINFSFEDYEHLTLFGKTGVLGILNPLSSELAAMRTSLLPGLIRNSVLNLNRQEQNVRLFEIGKIFIPAGKGELPVEITKLAAAATGRRQPELWDKEEFEFYDFKNLLDKGFDALSISGGVRFRMATEIGFLHPGKSAVITAGGEDCGFMGELHPDLRDKLEIPKRLYVMELDLDKITGKSGETRKAFTPLPRFPAVRRDIALIIDEETPVSSILEEIQSLDSKLIEDAEVFDVFTGSPVEKGKKSVAVSLQLRAKDKTLTEDEINKVQDKTIKKLQLALGADLRTI